MKIRNAEMEFVVFDAGDVIATSLPAPVGPVTAWFHVSKDLVPNMSDYEDCTGYYNDVTWSSRSNSVFLWDGSAEDYFHEGNSYTLTSDSSYYVRSGGTISIFNATSGDGTAENQLTSFKAIMDWLDLYGKKTQ